MARIPATATGAGDHSSRRRSALAHTSIALTLLALGLLFLLAALR